MENIYVKWAEFWKALPEIKEITEKQGKRNGLSSEAAMLLTAFYEFNIDLSLANEKFKTELLDKGLLEYTENVYKVTGRGAILAKSFCQALQKGKCFNNKY